MKNSLLAFALMLLLAAGCGPRPVSARMSDEALLDTVERYTIRYFTDFADPEEEDAEAEKADRRASSHL